MSVRHLVILASVIFIIGAFWVRSDDRVGDPWGSTGIVCISKSTQEEALVPYVHLSIRVDGSEERIPQDIGIREDCTAELFTRDDSGGVYIATERLEMRFKLRDFFAVWGRSLERPGYELRLTVNGTPNTSGGELIFKEGQRIELSYVSPSYQTATQAPVDLFEEESGVRGELRFD